ncbi:hypothetical protein JXL83_01680 [candidate division WOR-3 bacterium]|nr:hypothetical protein [candidate division WOR-3 bacterium]
MLFEQLKVKYDDGYINAEHKMFQEVGYPEWRLDSVGWKNKPTRYKCH